MRYRLEANGSAIGVADERLVSADGAFDVVVSLPETLLRPGLINAHDHLHRNHYPRLGSPPYEDAYEWGRDLHERCGLEIARARALPRRDALLFGAFRNLIAGVTTVVHHDTWEDDLERDFPVHVLRVRHAHSLGFGADAVRAASAARAASSRSIDAAPAASDAMTADARPFSIHLAEGVNAAAADEIRTLDELGLLDDQLLAVHVVGADEDGIRRIAAARAAVVWCPTSNHFLFGRTCPRALLDHVDVLLGSDALLTADGTLLDELRAARALGLLDDARLEAAVGATAARRLGTGRRMLAPGMPADLVMLRRPLLEAHVRDVALVIVAGKPRFGDACLEPFFRACGVAVDHVEIDGVAKIVTQPLGRIAAEVVAAAPECGRLLAGAPSALPAAVAVPDV